MTTLPMCFDPVIIQMYEQYGLPGPSRQYKVTEDTQLDSIVTDILCTKNVNQICSLHRHMGGQIAYLAKGPLTVSLNREFARHGRIPSVVLCGYLGNTVQQAWSAGSRP